MRGSKRNSDNTIRLINTAVGTSVKKNSKKRKRLKMSTQGTADDMVVKQRRCILNSIEVALAIGQWQLVIGHSGIRTQCSALLE